MQIPCLLAVSSCKPQPDCAFMAFICLHATCWAETLRQESDRPAQALWVYHRWVCWKFTNCGHTLKLAEPDKHTVSLPAAPGRVCYSLPWPRGYTKLELPPSDTRSETGLKGRICRHVLPHLNLMKASQGIFDLFFKAWEAKVAAECEALGMKKCGNGKEFPSLLGIRCRTKQKKTQILLEPGWL